MGRFRQTLGGAALAAALTPIASAAGDAPELGCACPRLSASQWQELEARVFLLFAERQLRPRGVELHCNAQRAWVIWEGERLRVAERRPLSDAFLDAIDARLALGQRDANPGSTNATGAGTPAAEGLPAAEVASFVEAPTVEQPVVEPSPAAWAPEPPPGGGSPSPGEVPQFDRPARTRGARGQSWLARYSSAGGLALGISGALGSSTMQPGWGPRLEFGIPAKLLSVIVSESALFSSARDDSIMVLDLEVGAAFGAPYVRGAVFGANVRLGSGWLVGYSEESTEGARTAWAPTLTLGLRTAATTAPVTLWAGIDARVRMSSLELGDPINASTPQVLGLGTVGVAFLAEGDKKD